MCAKYSDKQSKHSPPYHNLAQAASNVLYILFLPDEIDNYILLSHIIIVEILKTFQTTNTIYLQIVYIDSE